MKVRPLDQSYEVLDYRATIEVLDPEGRRARYERREHVRFIKDVTIIHDYGWGNGIAFAEHDVSIGAFTDRRLVGNRLRSKIKLPARQHAGDELTFTVDRAITNGFLSPSEWWLEAELYHVTRRVSLSVLLPGSRPVLTARLLTLDKSKGTPLRVRTATRARQQLLYEERNPALGQRFTLTWHW